MLSPRVWVTLPRHSPGVHPPQGAGRPRMPMGEPVSTPGEDALSLLRWSPLPGPTSPQQGRLASCLGPATAPPLAVPTAQPSTAAAPSSPRSRPALPEPAPEARPATPAELACLGTPLAPRRDPFFFFSFSPPSLDSTETFLACLRGTHPLLTLALTWKVLGTRGQPTCRTARYPARDSARRGKGVVGIA